MSVRTEALPQVEAVHTTEAVQAAVRDAQRILPIGAGTKPAMRAAPPGTLGLELRGLSGIVEYEPAEYTITALAGTSVAEINAALRKNQQYLPFDPVLVDAGATVGGTVAAGLSGPGRLRYGGLRDFILGARFVDGQARLLRGGGKVVKNAAGFDFPKLLVGSMGRLGILIDATFKVFPCPATHATLLTQYADVQAALADMQRLSVSPIELIAADILVESDSSACTLATRIGGATDLLGARVERLQAALPASKVLQGKDDASFWHSAVEFTWADPDAALFKAPLTADLIPALEETLSPAHSVRRYSVAGNVLWTAWTDSVDHISELLAARNLTGVVVRGSVSHPLIGYAGNSTFAKRVKQALDPHAKFPPVQPH